MGDAHERRVAEELALRGWDVSPWGQGVLTEAVRVALRGTESSLRPAAGSGSPYHLVPTRRSLAFDEVFGTMQQRHTPRLGAA